jgi:hypothetical protein
MMVPSLQGASLRLRQALSVPWCLAPAQLFPLQPSTLNWPCYVLQIQTALHGDSPVAPNAIGPAEQCNFLYHLVRGDPLRGGIP